MIRIASYNVENLFARPKAFDGSDCSIGESILSAYDEVNKLFQKDNYDDADRLRMVELLVILDIYSINVNGVARRKRSSNPRWAWLRKNRGSSDRESLIPFLQSGGVFRKGLWGTRKTRPDKWEAYLEMNRSEEQASDHAALFINLDL